MKPRNRIYLIAVLLSISSFVSIGRETLNIAPYGKFVDGLLSKTSPEGWLLDLLLRQRNGLSGHPEALSYPYNTCLWAGDIRRMGEHGGGWWRYEQTAYYSDGLLRLGYALADSSLVQKGCEGVDYTLKHASEKGYLGHPCLWDGDNYKLDYGLETWPMSVFFRVMKAKYDADQDPRIPAALEKYYLLYTPELLGVERNMLSVEGMLWTYGITRNDKLLHLAEAAWKNAKSFSSWSGSLTPNTCGSKEPIYMHGVTYCEELKVPLLLAAYTGKREYLEQALSAESGLECNHLLPDGCISSVEQTRGNSVHWGHETCDVADFTWSLGYFLEITGEAHYADLIEKCVFNAGLGAVTKDFKALQYFSNLNQFIATSDSNHNPFFYGSTWAQYRPTHETECCAGNVHRILPNYVSRMWLKDNDGWPVAALYGPCTVDLGWARIKEETEYPYSEKIRFVFTMEHPKVARFSYRVPEWCTARNDRGTFVTIEREFKDGDILEIDLPMDTVYDKIPRRQYVFRDYATKEMITVNGPLGSQGTVVRRGPLLFAYAIPSSQTEDVEVHANMRGKKSGNPDFKCWNMRPDGPFNYALVNEECTVSFNDEGHPFDPVHPMLSLGIKVKRIKWELIDNRFTPDIPETIEPLSGEIEDLQLVPYGATCLRLSVFPTL